MNEAIEYIEDEVEDEALDVDVEEGSDLPAHLDIELKEASLRFRKIRELALKKIAADRNYRELKYTNKFEKFAQATISVSGEAPSKIAGDAVKSLMLTLLRPLKQQNNKQIYLIQMNLNLGVNKKDNKYDAKESTASLAIVYADTPHAKNEDLNALSDSDAAKEASQKAMLKLIDVFNKDPVGKMPDPKQDPTEVPIRFVPRPRTAYEWAKKDILKV